MTPQPGIPDDGWDARLASLGGHFLQSRAWARCQMRMGFQVAHGSGEGWMWLGILHRFGPFARLYLPYGPQVRDAAALRAAVADARTAAAERRCTFLHFEPCGDGARDVRALGARRVKARQPEYTWVIKLERSEDELRAALARGHRSRINAAPRKDIAIGSTTDIAEVSEFLGLLHQTYDRAHAPTYPDSYYRTVVDELTPTGEARLYFARHDGRALAGAIVIDFGDVRYYAWAGTSSDPEAGRRGAAPALVWATMLDARAAGKRWFDFWGVAPPNQPNHAWAGFTEFKRGFGGELLQRSGTWDIPVRPFAYATWSVLNRLRRA